jgi:sigma-B regulation protein RsbU (phosphoserine phosphatase)
VKILVVDDEPALRLLVTRRLAQLGRSAIEAEDGQAAWELFQREHFELVITDWMMPRMSGLDLIRSIRGAGRPDYTYIIVVTSMSEREYVLTARQAGADDFLTKPIDAVEFLTRITIAERVLNMKAQLRESRPRPGRDTAEPR